MLQDQPYLKPLTTASMSSSYFAPLQQKQKSDLSTEEYEQTKKEKISNLHSKLHQEADKISKWKTRVEMEMKQKDCKIQESSQTIESLRKSILELQLQNESLSLKLQEEMSNREEILQKIEATRVMCNLLKEYASKLEDRMKKCETSRTELKYQEKEHLKSYEVLNEQFKELQAVSVENYKKLTDELNGEQEAKKMIEKKYKEQIAESERELHKLVHMTTEKDKMIESINQKLEKNIGEINQLMKDKNLLKQKLDETAKVADSQLYEIAEKETELKTTHEEKERLDAQLEEVSTKLKDLSLHNDKLTLSFSETEKLYASKIANLQDDLASHQQSLELSTARVQVLEAEQRQSQQVIEELKSAKDMLQLDKAGMERSIVNMMAEKDELEKQLRAMEQQSEDLSSTATEKDNHLKELRKNLQQQEGELSRAKSAFEEVERHLAQMQEENETISMELKTSKTETKKIEKQVKKLQKEKEEMAAEIASMKAAYDTLCSEKETVTEELQELNEKLNAQNGELVDAKNYVERLEAEKEAMSETSNSMLKEESKHVQVLTNQLEASKKSLSDLEAKVATMKQEISAKNKQIKENEKEAKATKKDINAKDKKVQQLEGKLEDMKQELVEATKAMDEVALERTKLEEMIESLKADTIAAQNTAQQAVKDKNSAQKELETTTKHMAKTIDEYKLENDKILQYRMERVEELKAKYEQKKQELAEKSKAYAQYDESTKGLQKLLDEKNNRLSELEDSCSALKLACEDQKKAIDKFEHKEKSSAEEMDKLNSVIEAKLKEIADLKKEVKSAKSGETAKRNKKISDLEAKNAELKAESKAKDSDIEKLKESETDKTSKIEELKSEVTDKDKEIEKLKKQNKEIEKLKKQNKEIEELKKQNKEIEELKKQNKEIEELKKQLAIAEANKNTKTVSTPKRPSNSPPSPDKMNVDQTPPLRSRLPKTPQSSVKHCDVKTPAQSSIMRQTSSASSSIPKRRKVAFTPKSPVSNSDSDGMEIDLSEVQRRMSSGSAKLGAATPLIRKSTPKISSVDIESPGSKPVSLKPKPRGPALTPKARTKPQSNTKTPVQKKPASPPPSSARRTKSTKPLTSEMEKFNELFPSMANDESTAPSKPATQNVRSTPNRAPGKFFKSRDRQKLTKSARTQKDSNQSWVDLDAVFGFGAED